MANIKANNAISYLVRKSKVNSVHWETAFEQLRTKM